MNNCKTWSEYFQELKTKYPNEKNKNILDIASRTFKEIHIKNTIIPYYCEFVKYTEKVNNDKPYNEILRETISYLKELKASMVKIGYDAHISCNYDIKEFERPIRKINPCISDKNIRAKALKKARAHKAIRDILKFWQNHIMCSGGIIKYNALKKKMDKYGNNSLTFTEKGIIKGRCYCHTLNNGEIFDHIIIFLNYILDKEENNLWPWKRLYYNIKHITNSPSIYLNNW